MFRWNGFFTLDTYSRCLWEEFSEPSSVRSVAGRIRQRFDDDGSGAGINVSYWGWDLDDAPLFATRYRLFQLDKGGDHYVAYGEQWVSNRNHS